MNESNIKGVSIRSILAFLIVLSCCGVAVYTKELLTLKDLAFLVLGFYFGQKPAVPANTSTTIASTTDKNVVVAAAAPAGPEKQAGHADFKALILICFMAILGTGCASYTFNHLHGNANGTYLYNGIPVQGNFVFDSYSCVGFGSCTQLKNMEITNADNSGSSVNSTNSVAINSSK